MANVEPLSRITNFEIQSAVGAHNGNLDKIEDAFDKALSREEVNEMQVNLDMGGHRIINVDDPVNDTDAVNKQYIDNALDGIDLATLADLGDISELVEDAQQAAANAAASALEAANYVGAATSAPNWTTARTITLTGDVNATSPAWDGSTNLSFAVTIPAGSVEGSQLASGSVVSHLGYTPANKAGETFTGPVRLNYTATSLTEDAAGFRGIPLNIQDNDYVFVMNDAGRMIQNTGSTNRVWYVPANSSVAYPLGTAIVVRNVGTATITIAPATGGVTVRLAGSGVSGNKTLAQWGLATLIKEGTDFWVLSGTGVSNA